MVNKPIAVIGAGSWGSALAVLLARNGNETRLWGRSVDDLITDRCNKRYLPNIIFPEKLSVHADLAQALFGVGDVLIVVPSQAFTSILKMISPYLSDDVNLISATKGLESDRLFSDVVAETLNNKPLAILSGPSFALEVAADLPTAVAMVSTQQTLLDAVAPRFHSQRFRVYTGHDIVGVQIAGAIKNIIAIAVGVSDGLGFGANAGSALITRGLAEIKRLGKAVGACQDTFTGLAGVGDLVLTCSDNKSRNRRFGVALGQGVRVDQALSDIGQAVEGIDAVAKINHWKQTYNVEMPIVSSVDRLLSGKQTPMLMVEQLLSRAPKSEIE